MDLYAQHCHALYLKGTGQQVRPVPSRVNIIILVKFIPPEMKSWVGYANAVVCYNINKLT